MLQIHETYVNVTLGHIFGESDWHEPYTTDKGQLFRDMQSEYGRCTGKVYVDTKAGTLAIGWVFVKRMKYVDCDDYYLQETWVTFRTAEIKHATID